MEKDFHPRVFDYSLRDYDTGWVFDEIKKYTWRFDGRALPRDRVKHALIRQPDRTIYVPAYESSICRTPSKEWRGVETREDRIIFHDLHRCAECLRIIGAPEWEPSAPPPRRKHDPENTPFNASDTTMLTDQQPETGKRRRWKGRK